MLISLHSQNGNAKIAQLVEHDLAKVGVAGSSPVFRSKDIEKLVKPETATAKIAQLVEHDLAKVGVAGSSPVFRSRLVRVAEWQTRYFEGVVSISSCEFDSHPGH